MKRVKIFSLVTLALTFMSFVTKMESQFMPPVIPFPPPSLHPLCSSQLALVSYACAMLPPTMTPPPSPLTPPPSPSPLTPPPSTSPLTPPSSPSPLTPPPSLSSPTPGDDEGHRSGQSPQEKDCCRWARQMDSQCVCEFLLLLPPFLTRPIHQYSIRIGQWCNVSYSCGGSI